MHSNPKKRFIAAIGPILLILISTVQAAVRAAPLGFWTNPQWIPGLVDGTPTQIPLFITDQTGKVHVIHTQWVGERFSIMYSTWSVGVGWSKPVDIFMTTMGQTRVIGASLGSDNILSVTYWGGEEVSADIYLIQAPIQNAGKASAWSKPYMIGTNAIAPTTGSMTNVGDGEILVVYSGGENGNGLYSVFSDDRGMTWTAPQPVYLTGGDMLWATGVKIFKGSDDRVHLVWALGDTTGNSREVYYSGFTAETNSWTEPLVLDRAIEFEADTPNIIEHDGSLIVIYHNGFPTTRHMTRSFDGGKTWTPPTQLFEHVGSNGAAALVTDSSNTLHMFFGNRVGFPAVHGLWHSTWTGTGWSVPEAVVSGPMIEMGDNGEEGFDPSYAQALVVQGNLALVVWRHDPRAGPLHIWYSYSYLDAPQIPTVAWETAASPTPPLTEVQNTPTLPTLAPTFAGEIPQDAGGSALSNTLAVGIGPAVILILASILLRRKVH